MLLTDNIQILAGLVVKTKAATGFFSEYGELTAPISGKLRNNSINREDFPAVGDWVVFEKN